MSSRLPAFSRKASRLLSGPIRFDHILHDSPGDAHIHARPLELPVAVFGLAVQPKKRGDEQKLSEALHRLMAGRTTFMIAHRLSTLQRADLILVLHQGRLVEQGTADELLRRGGLYRQLHAAQAMAAPADAEEAPA